MIFVTVGSQKFQFNRLLRAVDDLIEQGIIKDKVFAQIGVSDYVPKHFEYTDFTTRDEFNAKLDACDLLITHAGTGVIVNALKKGKKVIALPRLQKFGEHVDDHQVQLIDQFRDLNLLEPCYKTSDLPTAIQNVRTKSYGRYISNTSRIIQNIEQFIGENPNSKAANLQNSIKILMVMTSKFHRSGITMVLLNYRNELEKKKCQIDFAVPKHSDESLIRQTEKKGSRIFLLSKKMRVFLTPLYLYKLSTIVKRGSYDIVHVHGSSSLLYIELLAAKLGGAKIRIAHSHSTTTNHKILNKLLRKKFSNSYTTAFACSKDAGEWLFNNKEFTIINNGINTKKFIYDERDRNEIRKKYKIKPDEKVLGHIGLFNEEKNQMFLLDILEKELETSPKTKLLLAGNGPLKKQVKAEAKKRGLEHRIIFLSETNKPEKLYSAMDAFVMPSRHEGFGLAALEAQISGLPCILSNNFPKQIKINQNVKFVSTLDNDIEKWLKAIQDTIVQPRKANVEVFLDYDTKNCAKKLFMVYRKLMTKGHHE